MRGHWLSHASLLETVGNTPLVELGDLGQPPGVRIFAKLEGGNPTGSIKDRIADFMVREAEESGALRPGQTILEASTGNTAIALASIARQRGYAIKAVVPQGIAPSIADLLELFGVEIIWVEPRLGMKGPMEAAQRLAGENGWWLAGQFTNPANVRAHYETTGPEILDALPDIDLFVAGVGTGGTLTGVGRRLKERAPGTRVVAVEPRFGERLQGIRSLDEGYIPPLLDRDLLDGQFLVDAASAFAAMRHLVDRAGLFAGVSSGAALHAALRLASRMERGNIVVMFADHGWKYVSSLPWVMPPAEAPDHPDNVAWW